MEKSKKNRWFGTFLQRTMLWIRLRSWKRTTSAESCHRLRQTPSWSLHSDEKTKPRMSLILVGITGWVETITIEISNTSSNEVWDANPDPHLNWVFNRGKQSSEHYTVRTNVCSWTGWGGPDELVKFSVVMALTLKLQCLHCPHFLSLFLHCFGG